MCVCVCGPGSSVGIATELRAGRFGIESRWGRDFPPVQTGPGAHPASCKMGNGSFPGVKCGRGVLLTTHPLLVPRSWKNIAIPLPTSGPHRTCNGITLPLPLHIYIYIYIYIYIKQSSSSSAKRKFFYVSQRQQKFSVCDRKCVLRWEHAAT